MDHRQASETASYSLLKLVMGYMELDKKLRHFCTDTIIYPAEIHLIAAIANNPDIHIRGLAQRLHITSASISEMIGKLQKKGLVQKSADQDNLSRLKLSLTAKGQRAHEAHMRYHDELNDLVAQELKDASVEQVSFLRDFCDSLCERMESFQF